jgi:DNA polymerase III subunit gamma/tau
MAKRKATAPDPAPPAAPAEYTVVARRYRPQQFADLVGQEPVAQALVNALKSGRVAHAYLFTGARGVGKTSAARILAKALNCESGPTPTPCDRCESCRAIAAGADVDVLEIDGASNRRIEEVRDIRQNVQFRPTRGRYKIYIIDEVHMLTKEAFNALLKTLEEPPPHVKFIFATTDAQKVPITILSRCQRFDFAGIAPGRIVDCLREVTAAEGVPADEEALELVARRAGGSMRDAQSLLDQLLAFGGERMTADQVHRLLGTANEDQVAALAAAVLAKDAPRAIALLETGVDGGLQLGELVDQLVEYWRDLMLLACGGPDVAGLHAAPRFRPTLQQQAQAVPIDSILAGLDILSTTKLRLRGSPHGRVLVEMALIRLARLDDLVALSQLAHALEGGTETLPAPKGSDADPARTGRTTTPTSTVDRVAELKKKSDEVREGAPPAGPIVLTVDTLARIWPEILTQVGPLLARELEKAGIPAISGPNHLVLRFSPEYNRQCTYCGDQTRVQRVQDALKRVTGQEWNLRVETTYGRNGPPAPPQDAPTAVTAEPAPSVVDTLGGKLFQMDEGFGTASAVPAHDATAGLADTEEA